jgi:formylglycine-generating enzyme required for sulfatase activity
LKSLIFLFAALVAMPALVEPGFAQRNLNVAASSANEQRGADSLQWLNPGTVFKDCDACPEMVVIPAGSFTMGSPASEPGRYGDEHPQHQVTISRQFAAGKFEVTFDEWDACVRESGCGHFPSDSGWVRGRRPVTNVSWDDAKQYVQWLSRKTGRNYRLLTEAEWEYVARAGTTTAFSFGSTLTPQQANYHTEEFYADHPAAVSRGQTVPVGSYAPNAFGVYDVHGNVWEWTEDCWNANYSGAPTNGSAWVAGDCFLRVLRGGSWSSGPWALRSAFRSLFIASSRSTDYGFRLARTD